MKRPLPLKIAKVLIQLGNGEVIPASSAKHKIIEQLIEEDIIWCKGKHKKTLQLRNREQLNLYISNQLQINDIALYVSAIENNEVSRSELVNITTDSKTKQIRSFQGFLVNSYQPIEAFLNNKPIIIEPTIGSFLFIYDFETFIPQAGVTIVGIENPTNFRAIDKQKQLFESIKPLFISRYPQNQNKDVIRWLKSIPNKYLHFGDFDIAGIGIYLNEYKKHLDEKASFLIPKNIEITIRDFGNRERFDNQKINFNPNSIEEQKLKQLLEIIHGERKGLDQEYFINGNANP